MKRASWVAGLGLGLCILGLPRVASATDPNPYDEAEAEQLKERVAKILDEADKAMAEGRYTTACPLYEWANTLLPDLKTEVALIECTVKLGHYADAYRRMLDAAAKAENAVPPDPQAAEWARKRADEIKEQAPCIVIQVSGDLRKIPKIDVELDSEAVPSASWNRDCRLVNVGNHTIKPHAPDATWNPQREYTLVGGKQYRVMIPPPVSVAPPVAPATTAPRIPIAAFLIPAAVIFGGGIVTLVAMDHNPEDPLREILSGVFLGGGGGCLIGGLAIYATSTPSPQNAAMKLSPTNVGVRISGRF